MKKRISLLLFATMCFSVVSHSQSYIEETKDIIKFSKLIRQLHGNTSQVSVNSSTGEVIINDPLLDKTLKTIAEKVKGTELKNSPNNDSFIDHGTNPSSPTPGSISQNPNRPINPNRNQPDPSMNRIPKDSSSTDIIALNNSLASKQKLDNEVYIELKYLAFLVYNTDPTDYLNSNLSEAFPKHFNYLPLNSGLRRSRNAATPSWWSSLMLASANWSTSIWLARSSSACARRLTVSLVMATDGGGWAATLPASAIAASNALPGSATSSTSRHS